MSAPPASITQLTREERHARLILEVLLGQPTWATLETVDWNLFARLGQRHAVLVRVADRLAALGVQAPRRFVAAADAERRRACRVLEVLRHVQATCERHRIAWMVPKALQRLPDVGDDLDLLVFASNAATDRLVLEGLPATGGRPTLVDRVAGSCVYTIAGVGGPDLALDIHHGRVGSAGQHAAFARTLEGNGRPAVLDRTQFSVPSPEDQLVLQGLEKVAGRRSFHLCDMSKRSQSCGGPPSTGITSWRRLEHTADGRAWAATSTMWTRPTRVSSGGSCCRPGRAARSDFKDGVTPGFAKRASAFRRCV